MKQEKNLFKKDLSNAEGSYTKCIGDNYELITNLGNDARIGVNEYINRIKEIIKDAHDTPAKRNFLLSLNSQTNKYKAMTLVSNAYLRGIGLEVL